ncbi:base excision DNA repair [Paramyrothecium foliicola]|nr:base excision DNA repair [Paramyrothecium foliicola]
MPPPRRIVTRSKTRGAGNSQQMRIPATVCHIATKETGAHVKGEVDNETVELDAANLHSKMSKSSQADSLSQRKWTSWARHSGSSPFPEFPRPTPKECQLVHRMLQDMHGDTVKKNFAEGDEPVPEGQYTSVMDALVVAALSQATSWKNAKRAMNNMKQVYGSTFAYEAIVDGGIDKLRDALRPGGMQNRKSKILMGLLQDVKSRHGRWDLQHLFDVSDSDVIKEVVSYWGLGPKCAHCLMSICLKRDRFAVDTHIYRLSGLWGWRPQNASVEKTQAHLDAHIPDSVKFLLHYGMIVHGRECVVCSGRQANGPQCSVKTALGQLANERKSRFPKEKR